MNSNQSFRFTILKALFTLLGILIVGRMVGFQTGPEKEIFKEQGESYSGETVKLEPPRGSIYDRWGHLLAGNEPVYEIYVDMWADYNAESIALASSQILGLDYIEVMTAIDIENNRNIAYYPLARNATVEQAAQFKDLINNLEEDPFSQGTTSKNEPHSMVGLEIRPHFQRIYPEKKLASNVLGFVNQEPRSVYGVEGYYDELLAGVAKEYWRSYDPNRVSEMPEATEGASLILTLDREIQATLEEILDKAILEYGSQAGTIIVMQPETGEILGMASSPRIDINEYWQLGEVFQGEQTFNMAISSYEPGSVFKVFTMGAALDSGTVKPETPFIDTGVFKIGGVSIYNWDRGAWGPQTMTGCMQHSLNVCLSWVASEMGEDVFYSYLQKFGFGNPTGVELDLEFAGHLKLPGDPDWYEADLATNSFGQGISVTPLQMLMGVSAYANDGQMVVPRIVHAVVDRDYQYPTSVQIAGNPVSAETARTLTELLAISLEGEASDALVPGFRVAGKTGTAEIPTPQGYTTGLTNASFVGWGPVDDPQFIVYIWLEKPTTSMWGSLVAAPVFSEVVQRLVVLMNIPPDTVRQTMALP